MIHFLADENFPRLAASRLSSLGHDIVHVGLVAPSSTDEDVIARALAESRVILTFDKDFGELAYHRQHGSRSGVVLFRLPLSFPARVIDTIVATIEACCDWAGHFSVVEPHRIRMRPLD